MNDPIKDLFYKLGEKVIAYLPSLIAGLLLLAIGWFLGWFMKRIVVRACVILRVDRLLQRLRWGEEFSKADVRYAFYDFVGNVTFLVVFLVFLSSALSVMNLVVLSSLLEKGILFLPRLVTSLLILGIGWYIASWVSGAIRRGLIKEEIPRAALIARFAKMVFLLFFSAMALTELDIAREVVIIGYTSIIITLGVLVIVVIARGGKNFINKILETFEEE